MKGIKTIIAISLILVVAVGISIYSKNDINPVPTEGAVVNIGANEAFENSNTSNNKIDAVYSDGAISISEMKKSSDLIVTGKVIAKEQVSEFSVCSTISVEKAYKGNSSSEIYVLEMIGDSLLDVDEEFILFLGEQGDNKESKYFIKGGIQGALKKEANNKLNIKDKIIKEDFEKIRKERNNVDEWNTIIDYVKK